jgi:5-methylcytosine-specific restriction enzyme A
MRVIKSFYQSTDWFKVRAKVMARDGYLCQTCGLSVRAKGQAHVDHLITRRARPDLELTPSNLITLCVACHSRKTRAMDTATGSRQISAPRPPIDINGFPEGWR